MDFLSTAIDVFLHLDVHLREVVAEHGAWTYAILFAIVFLETGIVVTPFLPGDSLLFAAGAIASLGSLDLWLLIGLLAIAAIVGDALNYWIGRKLGPRVFTEGSRFFKREHLLKTQQFYDRHGGKTIILARFVPIVRTFAPFVAGIGRMSYAKFAAYNVAGGIFWVVSMTLSGYFFGAIPWVQKNFSVVVIGIVVISVLPIGVEIAKARLAARSAPAA